MISSMRRFSLSPSLGQFLGKVSPNSFGPPKTLGLPMIPSAAGGLLKPIAVATAPDAGTAQVIQSLPDTVVAHLASVGGAQTDGIDASSFWQTQTLNPVTGVMRKPYPVVPLFAQVTTAAGATTGKWQWTPTEDVYIFRLIIPSGQVTSAEITGDFIVNQRLVNVSSAAGAPFQDFQEGSRLGKISVGLVKAGQPIVLNFSGATASTTYYACLLGYGLQESKKGPRNGAAPDYMGYCPLGITTLTAGASGTISFTPVTGFRPRGFVFDHTQTNAAQVVISSITQGPRVETATNNANCPAVIFSDLADDDFIDFDFISRNTPCTISVTNTNATASAKIGGHIWGECWYPENE